MKEKLLALLGAHFGKILGSIMGLIVGWIIIAFGILKGLLVVVCIAAGFFSVHTWIRHAAAVILPVDFEVILFE